MTVSGFPNIIYPSFNGVSDIVCTFGPDRTLFRRNFPGAFSEKAFREKYLTIQQDLDLLIHKLQTFVKQGRQALIDLIQ